MVSKTFKISTEEKEKKKLREKILALPRDEYIIDEAHEIPTFRKRIPYDQLLDDDPKVYNYLKVQDIIEGLEPLVLKIGVPIKYLEKAGEFEPKQHKGEIVRKGTAKRMLNRAIFLQGLYKKAELMNISPKYIDEEVEPDLTGAIPDLGKMDKSALQRIINNAKRVQSRMEKGGTLESAVKKSEKRETWRERRQKRKYHKYHELPYGFLILLSGGIFLSGLFLLSSNITGYSIANLADSTSNIIGVCFLVCGLATAFFLLRKNSNKKF